MDRRISGAPLQYYTAASFCINSKYTFTFFSAHCALYIMSISAADGDSLARNAKRLHMCYCAPNKLSNLHFRLAPFQNQSPNNFFPFVCFASTFSIPQPDLHPFEFSSFGEHKNPGCDLKCSTRKWCTPLSFFIKSRVAALLSLAKGKLRFRHDEFMWSNPADSGVADVLVTIRLGAYFDCRMSIRLIITKIIFNNFHVHYWLFEPSNISNYLKCIIFSSPLSSTVCFVLPFFPFPFPFYCLAWQIHYVMGLVAAK